MKNKLLSLLVVTLLLTGCGNTANTTATTDSTTPSSTIEESEATVEPTETSEAGFSTDKGLFNVEITIPASFVEDQTQEDLDVACAEAGYKSITLNDDGTATYIMSKNQHSDMMKEMENTINTTFSEMIGSEDYPNITDITSGKNYTEFTITTKSAELDLAESFSTMLFYMYGGMYNAFNGSTADNIVVTFINADNGEVITTSNSAEMKE